MTRFCWLLLVIFTILSEYQCYALIRKTDKKNGTEVVKASIETSSYKLRGTEDVLVKFTLVPNGNNSINETEILENWFQFKHRFALQCTLVFLLLLCVMFLCFFPGKQQVKAFFTKHTFLFGCLGINYHNTNLPAFTFCQPVE